MPQGKEHVSLGPRLKAARTALGMTLREVEAATGISNGYLSQLEADSIKQPSPHHLHKLAEVYSLSYAELMKSAGYAFAESVGAVTDIKSREVLKALDELSDEDRRKIQAYIEDLRAARRARSQATDRGAANAGNLAVRQRRPVRKMSSE